MASELLQKVLAAEQAEEKAVCEAQAKASEISAAAKEKGEVLIKKHREDAQKRAAEIIDNAQGEAQRLEAQAASESDKQGNKIIQTALSKRDKAVESVIDIIL